MTESRFTSLLIKTLKLRLPAEAVIYKHSDRFSRGVPDFSISIGKKTLWVEVKVEPNMPTKIQEYFLKRHAEGAVLLCASHDGRNVAFTSPLDGMSRFMDTANILSAVEEWFDAH